MASSCLRDHPCHVTALTYDFNRLTDTIVFVCDLLKVPKRSDYFLYNAPYSAPTLTYKHHKNTKGSLHRALSGTSLIRFANIQ